MYRNNIITIISEVKSVLEKVCDEQIVSFVKEIVAANTIVVYGAGRVGYAVRGFGMRLGHLGFKAYTLGDSTVPSISDGDLLIVASGSGETQTVYDVAEIGKRNGARIAVITGAPESRIGKIANCMILMKAPSKVSEVQGIKSIQPMSTLNEQCLQILFDSIVLELMEMTNQTHYDMWKRHSNLE
jgi:6-phospho-3-hexuloisomerase